MSKRGNRSPKGKYNQSKRQIRYALKTIINREAWHCPIWAETICLTSKEALISYGYEYFKESFSITYVPDVDSGTVLNDSRGRGAFQ